MRALSWKNLRIRTRNFLTQSKNFQSEKKRSERFTLIMKDQDKFEMNILDKRLKSFKKWPFKEPFKCTKEKMAEAGFYFIGSKKEPDLACCFVCLKELDGWEEDDDPWEEHKSHAPNCPFIILGKKESECTYKDMRDLELKRQIQAMTKGLDTVIKQFKLQAEETRKIIEEIG